MLFADQELKDELISFYSCYFRNKKECIDFIDKNLQCSDNTKRRMMNSVMRHVKISNYMLAYKPKRDALVIFNLVVAIESVYTISKSRLFKTDMIITFFKDEILAKHKQKIKDNFRYHAEYLNSKTNKSIDILEEFARFLYSIRNDYVHEGNYWEVLFSSENSNVWSILNKEMNFNNDIKFFETLLSIEDIRNIIVNGLINFIKSF